MRSPDYQQAVVWGQPCSVARVHELAEIAVFGRSLAGAADRRRIIRRRSTAPSQKGHDPCHCKARCRGGGRKKAPRRAPAGRLVAAGAPRGRVPGPLAPSVYIYRAAARASGAMGAGLMRPTGTQGGPTDR